MPRLNGQCSRALNRSFLVSHLYRQQRRQLILSCLIGSTPLEQQIRIEPVLQSQQGDRNTRFTCQHCELSPKLDGVVGGYLYVSASLLLLSQVTK
jgi:hypothetical protein